MLAGAWAFTISGAPASNLRGLWMVLGHSRRLDSATAVGCVHLTRCPTRRTSALVTGNWTGLRAFHLAAHQQLGKPAIRFLGAGLSVPFPGSRRLSPYNHRIFARPHRTHSGLEPQPFGEESRKFQAWWYLPRLGLSHNVFQPRTQG